MGKRVLWFAYIRLVLHKTFTFTFFFLSLWVLLGLQYHLLLVLCLILRECSPSGLLSRRIGVRRIQQILNAKTDLFQSNSRSPILFLIQYTETYSTTRVDVWMIEACWKFHLGWLWGILVWVIYRYWVDTVLPYGTFFTRDTTFPFLEV